MFDKIFTENPHAHNFSWIMCKMNYTCIKKQIERKFADIFLYAFAKLVTNEFSIKKKCFKLSRQKLYSFKKILAVHLKNCRYIPVASRSLLK